MDRDESRKCTQNVVNRAEFPILTQKCAIFRDFWISRPGGPGLNGYVWTPMTRFSGPEKSFLACFYGFLAENPIHRDRGEDTNSIARSYDDLWGSRDIR